VLGESAFEVPFPGSVFGEFAILGVRPGGPGRGIRAGGVPDSGLPFGECPGDGLETAVRGLLSGECPTH